MAFGSVDPPRSLPDDRFTHTWLHSSVPAAPVLSNVSPFDYGRRAKSDDANTRDHVTPQFAPDYAWRDARSVQALCTPCERNGRLQAAARKFAARPRDRSGNDDEDGRGNRPPLEYEMEGTDQHVSLCRGTQDLAHQVLTSKLLRSGLFAITALISLRSTRPCLLLQLRGSRRSLRTALPLRPTSAPHTALAENLVSFDPTAKARFDPSLRRRRPRRRNEALRRRRRTGSVR